MKQKKGKFYTSGTVVKQVSGKFFQVQLDNSVVVLGYLCGKMVKGRVKVLPDDRVTCEFDPVSFDKCRIVWRIDERHRNSSQKTSSRGCQIGDGTAGK